MTVDHLSGGRVELALGVGDPSAGAKAVGVDWPPGERVARFVEFVELVDLLLRQEVTNYVGRFYRCEGAETVPLPVQRPRPPVTIAAHGPKMLRIAAEHGDGWSSWGATTWRPRRTSTPSSPTADSTTSASAPGATRPRFGTRWSCFPPLTPWQSVEYFHDMVGRFGEIGIDEFVLYWPQTWRDAPGEEAVFEEVATTTVLPRMRGDHCSDSG